MLVYMLVFVDYKLQHSHLTTQQLACVDDLGECQRKAHHNVPNIHILGRTDFSRKKRKQPRQDFLLGHKSHLNIPTGN